MRRLLLALLVWLGAAACACAHEVRPALLQIVEHGPHAYDVTWKQPAMGEMVIHLTPRLSGGGLDAAPASQSAEPGFVEKTWRITAGPPLEGQTVRIEGLPETVTDVLLRITTADGRQIDGVLRPASPTQTLALARPSGLAVPAYLRLGVEHILTGFDHLLFVLGLLLLVGPSWRLVKTITAFTLSHSLTLALAALGYIQFPSAVIEALVALSIVFVATELAPRRRGDTLARRQPWLIAFSFGLLHGMAFAGALAEIGLPAKAAPQALFLFNVGVEIGQLSFIAAVLALLWLVRRTPARGVLARPLVTRWAPAYAIGGLSAFWLIERISTAVGGPA
ncbi:HupE/UreJ family protein [Phenylobacterium sp.]|uniref:HupE/UreJ family protein n=1 Tax=Phenylobacterium sp. TaxID=1871053 RepID=UPI002DED7748|nr:HupE/UreJ family protein [Phenylobacterium sp.]